MLVNAASEEHRPSLAAQSCLIKKKYFDLVVISIASLKLITRTCSSRLRICSAAQRRVGATDNDVMRSIESMVSLDSTMSLSTSGKEISTLHITVVVMVTVTTAFVLHYLSSLSYSSGTAWSKERWMASMAPCRHGHGYGHGYDYGYTSRSLLFQHRRSTRSR